MTNEENNLQQRDTFHQPEPITQPLNGSDKAADGLLRVVMLLISLISLGIAMSSMGYVALQLLFWHDERTRENLFPIVIAIGLAYAVGWLVALVGIRLYHNLVLPIAISVYAWATLSGVSILYIAILVRLYEQKYPPTSFFKYTILMGVALAGLVGLHLLIEGHSLRLFSIPLLLVALAHLYLIVYHYVFALDVDYIYLVGDILFFLGMTTVSILMLMHVGVLSKARETIDRLFDKNPNGNTQPLSQ